MSTPRFILMLLVMAGTTYLVRAVPLVAVRSHLKNRFLISMLHYLPYAVLAAMTFPAVFYATGSPVTAAVGTVVAIILSFLHLGLLGVALSACVAVFLAGFFF